MTKIIRNAVPPLERAMAVAINLYDRLARSGDDGVRTDVLLLLAHLREARKDQQ